MNEKKNISYRTFKSNIIIQYALIRMYSSILGTSNLLKVFSPDVAVGTLLQILLMARGNNA